jgi:hypothetical protein
MERVTRSTRLEAKARTAAALALLREAEQVAPRAEGHAQYLVELAFLQLSRAASSIEPELGNPALDALGRVGVREAVN